MINTQQTETDTLEDNDTHEQRLNKLEQRQEELEKRVDKLEQELQELRAYAYRVGNIVITLAERWLDIVEKATEKQESNENTQESSQE